MQKRYLPTGSAETDNLAKLSDDSDCIWCRAKQSHHHLCYQQGEIFG
jgi:hypothetical protein